MNERIRELKNQTLDKHFSYTWSKMDYDDVTKFAEKFAELIVRECAEVCNRVYFDNYPDAEDFERSEEGDAIKQHFGVAE